MRVIVMELCTGGSLQEILDSPENGYGLGEVDFTKLISDLSKSSPSISILHSGVNLN